MTYLRGWARSLSLFLLLPACGKSATPQPEVPLNEYGSGALSWAPCPDDLGGKEVECAQVQVPWDWEAEEENLTSILLRRVRAEASEGSLWGLDGGPGFSGDSFLDPEFLELVKEANLDLYVPSHRGTIGESALYCPDQQGTDSVEGGRVTPDEWPGCRRHLESKWGKGLPPFTVRNGAEDVAHLMGRTAPEGRRLVFGGSYGSLWGHRLLLDTDASPTAVLLDSIVPIGATLERVDAHADGAAAELLRRCASAASCAARFEGDPLETSRAAIEKYAEEAGCGQQSGEISRADIQTLIHSLLSGPPDSWIRIIAVYERLARCSETDRAELIRVLTPTSDEDSTESPVGPTIHYNVLLNRHLIYRELYRYDETEEERSEFERSALSLGASHSEMTSVADAFGPDYRLQLAPRNASTNVPTFLISGQLDPLDPPEWADDFANTTEEGRIIRIPWAGHSALRFVGFGEGDCGRSILSSFLKTGEPDESCLEEAAAVDLGQVEDQTQAMLSAWFGSEEP